MDEIHNTKDTRGTMGTHRGTTDAIVLHMLTPLPMTREAAGHYSNDNDTHGTGRGGCVHLLFALFFFVCLFVCKGTGSVFYRQEVVFFYPSLPRGFLKPKEK